MKIGVFGDSFADKHSKDIWWQYLGSVHGHDVTSFGENGSSLPFSADLIDYHQQHFDKIIWCATSVNRITFWHNNKAYHNTGQGRVASTSDIELNKKSDIVHQYLTQVFDFHFQEMLGHALVKFMLQKYPHLTVIPCFETPMYFQQEPGFNLYELCRLEIEHCFPGQDPVDVILSPRDRRSGHLTKTNQKILARLINDNLDSSIFSTAYDNFVLHKDSLVEFGA